MNKQEIFDTVVTHLLSQKMTSFDERGQCAYRGARGLKCAVGCLIKDEHYYPELENKGVQHVSVLEAVELSIGLKKAFRDDVEFLRELQLIHDGVEHSRGWKVELHDLAIAHNLTWNHGE